MKKSNNMRLLLFIIIFLFVKIGTGFTQSQNVKPYSEATAIYKITNNEAKELLLSSKREVDDKYFHTYVDTFSTQYYKKELKGYFLFVKAKAEQLEVTLESYVFLDVILLNNKRDFAIQVIDTLGNTIKNATVLLEKKKIPFDPKTKTYRKRKKYKGGFLSISANGETLFLDAEPQDRRSVFSKKYRRFRTSKVGKVLIPPFYYKKNKRPRGYIALNKPKFLPGDTVKVKAYFTNHKGKPFKKKLQLNLADASRYKRKIYFKKDISPSTPGAYLYEFVLSDSLTLDEDYVLSFSYQKRKKKIQNVMSHSFYYEDYQLDEVDYTLRREKEEYYNGESIILFAEGKDKNNWTIPDGKIRLVATRSDVEEFYDKKVLIPDTLWEHSQDLATRGETQILFPTENLPNAKFTIEVEAEFFNSNGEMQSESIEFDYDGNEEKIEVKIEDGYIIAECFVNGKPVERKAELNMGNDEWVDIEEEIQLPYKAPINPFYSFYYFETEKAEADFDFDYYNDYDWDRNKRNEYEHNIIDYTYRTQDSVFATILNPNAVPINIQIRTKNNTITETITSEKKWVSKSALPKGKPCFLSYQFVWMRKSFERDKNILFEKKLLDIQTNIPTTVEPGEQVQVKVSIKDKKQRPRKNVNITAGAINAQFEDITNIREPSLTYKAPRRPRTYNSFKLDRYDEKKFRKSITKKWNTPLELSKSLFYRLRFPEKGVLMEYDTVAKDSFYHNIPQFAPYLVKDGKAQPIYMIYCNRQLVYYYDVDDNPPYSFVGQAGYNRIVIRSRDSVYTVDSVFLKLGHKLELSIDINHYRKSDLTKHIKVTSTTPELTKQEKALLGRKIFILRKYNTNQKNYVWQDMWNIHTLPRGHRNNRPIKIGPFFQAPIRFLERDGWSNKFKFEPYFVYDIEDNRERLYESPYFKHKSKIVLPKAVRTQQVGQIIYSPKQIEVESSFFEKINLNFKYSSYSYSKERGGTYEFKVKEEEEEVDFKKFAVVLLEDDTTFTIYSANTTEFYNLKSKPYTLIVFSPTGNYIKKEFTVPPYTLMYEDLTTIPFTVDSSQILFRKIFTQHLANLKSGSKKYPSPDFNRFSQNQKFYGTSGIEGKITDSETGEELIGANIVVKLNGNFVQGETTDIDGNFSMNLPEDTYDVEVSYTGYPTQLVEGVLVGNYFTKVDVMMQIGQGQIIDEIVVTGYKIPIIKQDDFGTGQTINSSQIKDLPSISVRGLTSRVAGVSISNEGDAISVRGSRSNATEYYIDGIRVSGALIPESKNSYGNYDLDEVGVSLTDIEQLRSKFSDYAYFHPNLITDQNGEAFFTITFPDNITAWKTFVVGMDNKLHAGTHVSETRAFKKLTAQLSLPRFLIEGDETNIIGKSINFTQDSFNIKTAFKLGDEILKSNQAKIKDAIIEKTNISTPENLDTLTLSYLLAMENYNDGEERKIPIFQKGVEETNGVFKVLNESDVFEKSFDVEKGEVQIRIEDNILEVLLEDLDFLKKYPYRCNEQTASRLIALLLEKDLKQLLGQKFKDEKKIRKAIRRLEKTQNADGSWGWWAKGEYNAWMTSYVLNALHKAKKANYKTQALDRGLVFLTNQLPALNNKNLLNSLLLFSDIEQNLDYENYINYLDTTRTSRYDKFALVKLRQKQGLPYSIDSVLQYKNEDVFGGWFFGEENYHWYNNSFQLSLLAHDIFQLEKDSAAVKNIQQYFLSKKTRRGWRNTFETAKILLAILPDLMNEKNSLVKNKVQLSGAMNETVSKFPFEAKFTSDQNLQIKKSGSSPIFFTAYQSFWNKKPKEKDDLFFVKTFLKQENKKTKNLKAAVVVDLIVELEVKKSADYVMIEIPIPAGCSYRSKPQNYFNKESYREYFKDRTAIFCEELPVGKYTFTIPLEPRFSGKYTLNPTKVEQMYFPVFYGRNEMGKILIEE